VDIAEFVLGGGVSVGEGAGLPRQGREQLGCTLMKHAVQWGLPGLATLLVELLMQAPHGEPAASAAFFAQLAHTKPTAAAAAAAATGNGEGGAEGGGLGEEQQGESPLSPEQVGGLLHLALLSPAPGRMLQAVLEWGRLHGGLSFSWRWDERSAMGLTPLCILGRHQQLLQQLMQDPAHGPAVRRAAAAAAAIAAAALEAPELSQQKHGDPGEGLAVMGAAGLQVAVRMEVRGWGG